jgi:hypothetical protein
LAKRDVALLKCWNQDLLDDCHQVAALKPHLAAAHKRLLAIAKLQAAVTAENELAYMALAAEEVLAPYEDADFDELIQCTPAFSQLLAQTKENHRAVDTLKSAIKEGDGKQFIDLYDQQLMERYKENFAEVEDVLPEFIENEVLSKIRLKKLRIGDSLVRVHGAYKAGWQWPKDGKYLTLLTKCIVGVGNASGKIPDRPDASQLLAYETVSFYQYMAAGGKSIPALPDWNGAQVVVWGELDIAGAVYYTKPVFLGTMEHDLNGLTSITDEQAENLGKVEGDYLDLNGLTAITDEQAEILSKVGILRLDGLTSITDAQAESLSKVKGYLTLNSLTSITDEQAESLSKVKHLDISEVCQELVDKYRKP